MTSAAKWVNCRWNRTFQADFNLGKAVDTSLKASVSAGHLADTVTMLQRTKTTARPHAGNLQGFANTTEMVAVTRGKHVPSSTKAKTPRAPPSRLKPQTLQSSSSPKRKTTKRS